MNAKFVKIFGMLVVASLMFAACAPAATAMPTSAPTMVSPTEAPTHSCFDRRAGGQY